MRLRIWYVAVSLALSGCSKLAAKETIGSIGDVTLAKGPFSGPAAVTLPGRSEWH